MKPIRNSAKAIIMEHGKILLTKNRDDQGIFYLFPGGGQEKGEELRSAVARECMEEIGCEVRVGDIAYIREYIGKNHQFADWDYDVHQVEFYFECSLIDSPEEFCGSNPDDNQIGVEWVEIDRLPHIRIYPGRLGDYLTNGISTPRYIGDSN
ncbi:NUDIX domain-containing protein [Paenibacillaceae bacterium WGS1546]|uniref:NUDIX domain-containing protein n=1 Tax=Cohnella sp. WGS1546 TaxID=3366810 RepID=UPI00372D187F